MALPGSGTVIPQDWALWEMLPCSQVQAGTSGSHLLSWKSPSRQQHRGASRFLLTPRVTRPELGFLDAIFNLRNVCVIGRCSFLGVVR